MLDPGTKNEAVNGLKGMAVSVVMPLYNEEAVIEKVVRDCYAVIIAKIPGSELLIVNDSSTDGSPEILKRLAIEFAGLRVIDQPENRGHGSALLAGFAQAKNPVIVQMDGDGQVNPEDFWKLYPLLSADCDLVIGCRSGRCDPWIRKAVSRGLKILVRAFFGFSLSDINSPLKCIKLEVLRDALKVIRPDSFIVSVLMVVIARHRGYRLAEVAVTHLPRRGGASRLSSWRYLSRSCIRGVADILRLRRSL